MCKPELSREIHVSNLVLHMDAKIHEVIDYLKMFQDDENISPDVLKLAIDKLYLI